MIAKTLLVASALVISSLAHAGPASTIPARAPAVDVNTPYAAYVPAPHAVANGHVYLGGPKSTIPHGR